MVVRCRKCGIVNKTLKSILYSTARVIDAEKYICIDADMLVLGDLNPILAALEACSPGRILVCREGDKSLDLRHAIKALYRGDVADIERITGGQKLPTHFDLIVNDGLFAGDREALLGIDGLLRRWTEAPQWIDERADVTWRNQYVFNLALAYLNCAVEMDPAFNVQQDSQPAHFTGSGEMVREAWWNGHRARVLHFNGRSWGRELNWRADFCAQARRRLADASPSGCPETTKPEASTLLAHIERQSSLDRTTDETSNQPYSLPLDAFPIVDWQVGYGVLGLYGQLGYEDKLVRVCGKCFDHAISAHAPSEVRFDLNDFVGEFRCQVALNDDALGQNTFGNFIVMGDGKVLVMVRAVCPGEPVREFSIKLHRVRCLVLRVETFVLTLVILFGSIRDWRDGATPLPSRYWNPPATYCQNSAWNYKMYKSLIVLTI